MSEDDLIEASPCKLRSGDWGCKTQEPVEVGATVRIVTRANKQWRAEISRIVWTDNQVCICETNSAQDKNAPGAPKRQPAQSTAAPSKPTAQRTPTTERPPADGPGADTPAPPRTGAMASDELDAMADAAAEQANDFDDLMNAQQEFENDSR